MSIRLIPILISIIISYKALGQIYIGVSCDVGNSVQQNSEIGDTYFKKGLAVSGSLMILKHEQMRKNWFLQYGLAAGVLGHNVKVELKDTLMYPMNSSPDFFLDYTNFYGSLQFGIGKNFPLGSRKCSFIISGGATRYFNMFPEGVTGNVGVLNDDNTISTLFYYEMLPSNKFSAFIECSFQIELARRVTASLSYRNNFNEALTGSYEFYHTPRSSYGQLSLTQKTLSLQLLVMLGKIKPVN
ncbi:MAG: hypothetical protein WAZ98_03980 [Cyclobacteriaceae bacterium]